MNGQAMRRLYAVPHLVAAVALILAHGGTSIRAESTITARLDVTHEATIMKGELRFDLSGGPVAGHADLTVASSKRSPPRRKSGGTTNGTFHVRIELNGDYAGGSFGSLKGQAKVTGTFTDEANSQSQVQGTGTFEGGQSGPLGGVEVRCVWNEVEFNGGDLADRQPFSALLHFTFEPTNEIPKLREQPPVAAASRADPNTGPRAAPAAPSSHLALWIVGGVCVLVLLSIIGVGIAKRQKS